MSASESVAAMLRGLGFKGSNVKDGETALATLLACGATLPTEPSPDWWRDAVIHRRDGSSTRVDSFYRT